MTDSLFSKQNTNRFESNVQGTLYEKLSAHEQRNIRQIALSHRLTLQEIRQIVTSCRDLSMWQEDSLAHWWNSQADLPSGDLRTRKKHLLNKLRQHIQDLKTTPKTYPQTNLAVKIKPKPAKIHTAHSTQKIAGKCPVASEKTVCCNLYTIDAVQNCLFGCSYCSIQTFYQDKITFDADFKQKLRAIEIDPNRFYHFGTGQASDSLAWGNRNGNLDALCQFAKEHPNILLEFKTKSNNIKYFLSNQVPRNIVCSWSLNSATIIANEEHQTASLKQRINAARKLADRGIAVAFHFHPMIHYQNWERDYPAIAQQVLGLFQPREVLFISFGSVTLIKPVIKQIRQTGIATKILQMDLVPDPHGKLTYPDDLKVKMFHTIYQHFKPWHKQVFMYLCMEKAAIWQRSFGYVYRDNNAFEHDFGLQTLSRLEAQN